MNYKLITLLIIVLVNFNAYSRADKIDHHHDSKILIKDPTVRVTPPGITNSAAYLSIINHKKEDLFIVGATSKISELTEIHEHTMKDGIMKMGKVKSISLPSMSTVKFQPGGYHIMLINLKKPITPDQEIELTLELSDGSTEEFIAQSIGIKKQMEKRKHEKMKHKHMQHH